MGFRTNKFEISTSNYEKCKSQKSDMMDSSTNICLESLWVHWMCMSGIHRYPICISDMHIRYAYPICICDMPIRYSYQICIIKPSPPSIISIRNRVWTALLICISDMHMRVPYWLSISGQNIRYVNFICILDNMTDMHIWCAYPIWYVYPVCLSDMTSQTRPC